MISFIHVEEDWTPVMDVCTRITAPKSKKGLNQVPCRAVCFCTQEKTRQASYLITSSTYLPKDIAEDKAFTFWYYLLEDFFYFILFFLDIFWIYLYSLFYCCYRLLCCILFSFRYNFKLCAWNASKALSSYCYIDPCLSLQVTGAVALYSCYYLCVREISPVYGLTSHITSISACKCLTTANLNWACLKWCSQWQSLIFASLRFIGVL